MDILSYACCATVSIRAIWTSHPANFHDFLSFPLSDFTYIDYQTRGTNFKTIPSTVQEFLLAQTILTEPPERYYQFIVVSSDLQKYTKFHVNPMAVGENQLAQI